jgi:type I restriction enzyme S subunit
MELKAGYKQTEVGAIPEEWNVCKLEELIDLLTDYESNGSFASLAENVSPVNQVSFAWYVRSTDIENDTPISNLRYVDESSYRFLKKTSLFGGELLFLKKGDVGRVYLFKLKTKYATLADNLYLLNLNKKSNSVFLYNYFKSETGQNQIKSRVAASSIPALYKDEVKSILVPLPTLTEQTAIATALSDADTLISSLEKLIAKKRNIKQGAMQKLLQPKNDWEVKKLGDICEIFKGKGISKSYLTENGKNKCVLYGELFTTYLDVIKEVVSNTNVEEGVFSKKGDILFPGSTTTTGIDLAKASVLMIDNVLLGGDIIVLRKYNYDYNPIFFTYFLNQIKKHVIAQTTKGITIHHLYGKDLAGIYAEFPKKEEQTQLEKYRNIKLGMMQNLLTGKIRLV